MRQDIAIVQAMIDVMVGVPKFSYPARQNEAPRPANEFAHIRLLEEYPENIPSKSIFLQDDLTTTYRTYGVATLRFRIGVIETSGLAAAKIMHGWTSEDMKALMIESGYGFIKCEPLSNEDAKLEKEWEFRQGFSLELYNTRVFEEVVDNITALEISGEFITPGLDSILLNIDINNT